MSKDHPQAGSVNLIEDVRLIHEVSNMVLELVMQARDGELEDMDDGDIDGVCMTRAVKIIEVVRRAA